MGRRVSSLSDSTTAIRKDISSDYDNVKLVADNIDDVNVLADSIDDINNVSGISEEVVTVSSISAEIESLFSDKAVLDSLFSDKTTLDSLSNDKAVLDSLYADKEVLDSLFNDKGKLDSLFNDKTVLDSLYADKATLDSLFADKTTLDTLFNDKASLDRIHSSISNIDRVFTSIAGIDRVNTSIENIDRVFTSISNIDRVFSSITNIDTLAVDIANIDTVADNVVSVVLVADSIEDVNTAADNIYEIQQAAGNATIATQKAAEAAQSAVDAEASALDWTNFKTGGGTLNGPINVTADITTSALIDGRNISVDGSKLDGVESGADVTDTANVTNAGALMDSEVSNLDQVKSFDSSDYATSVQGALADTALQTGDNISSLVNDSGFTTNVGNIVSISTGDGLDITNSSGVVDISHSDTSNQGSVNNSGVTYVQDIVLDDFGHITGISSGTTTLAGLGYTGELNATADQTKSDIDALDVNAGFLGSNRASYFTDYTDAAIANVIGSAPETMDTLNELAAALGDDPNFATTISNQLGTKLNSADYTASDVLNKIKSVDGSGSGLDADLLDGQQGSYYQNASNLNSGTISDARLPATITSSITGNAATATKLATARNIALTGDVTGSANFDGSGNVSITATVLNDSHNHSRLIGNSHVLLDLNALVQSTVQDGEFHYHAYSKGSTGGVGMANNANGVITLGQHHGGYNAQLSFSSDGNMYHRESIRGSTPSSWGKLWTSSNDGPASGLDADLLDGRHGSFYRDASHLNVGTISDARLPASITSSITGNAATATKLATARNIALAGDVTGSASFDGSGNVSITATVKDDSHNHTIANVDGLQAALDTKQSSLISGTSIKTVNGVSILGAGDLGVGGGGDFVAITEGSNTGYGTSYRAANPSYYDDIGNNAVDLSYSSSSSAAFGASGIYSTAMGSRTTACGSYSTAMGRYTTACGSYSTAMGDRTTARGNYSTAMGRYTTACGSYSTAMGNKTTASGNCSTAMGDRTTASGIASVVMGYNAATTCPANNSRYSLVMQYNAPTILLCASEGNGYFDGGADIGVAADYAEYFESANGSCLERGHFVSFAEGSSCICYGNTELLGIVSADPAIVGDTQAFQYQGVYLKDEFGVYIRESQVVTGEVDTRVEEIGDSSYKVIIDELPNDIESFEVVITNKETKEIVETISTLGDVERIYDFEVEVAGTYKYSIVDRVKNPDYDSTLDYLPRSARPEWSPIGLLGKLWVYLAEDELVSVGDYVTANSEGKAIKCLTTDRNACRVMETNPEFNLVKVFFKGN